MKLKMTEDGKGAVVKDGKPVYIHDDGKEVEFDVVATVATISRLNGEAKGHREGKETAEAKLKAFEGIEDPAAAIKALGIVKNLDEKKLIDAGKVEEIRGAAIKAVRDEFAPVVAERDKLKGDLYSEKIGGAFSRSKYIADKLAIPAELVQSHFGKHFEVKDGKTVAKDAAGNPIYSRARPGEIAEFDEAMEVLVNAYPQKDVILKGTGGTGSGANPSRPAGSKTIARADFAKLDPAEQQRKVMVDKVQVVD